MVTLILAEKERQARAYAEALGKPMKRGEVYIVEETPFFSDEVHVVAAEGHLFEYNLPDNNWDLDSLPLVDVVFKQELKKDKTAQSYFNRIYQEVVVANQIIIGTDADREGERIAYSILSRIPGGKEKIWKRLWVNSLTKKALHKAFQELREPEETYNYYLEAEARAQSDWLVGMNLSPLVTLKLQEKGQLARKKGSYLSVGRVQTPAVRLICENDLAIRNFTPEQFWKIQLEDQVNGVFFMSKEKTTDSDEILEVLRSLETTSTVTAVELEDYQKPAPKLFNLSDLQGLAASHWKFEPKKTESLVESLYLKGYLSYPRTDTRYITSFEFEYLKDNLPYYQETINCRFEAVNLDAREDYVNAEAVAKTSHYALIPTEKIPNLLSLSSDERLIYETVVKQTILMFAADCYYSKTTVFLENCGQEFKTVGRQMKQLGWAEWSLRKVRGTVNLPHYSVGDKIATQALIVEGMTKPPKRITEAQLISEIFPKYGLGTQATRATVIKTIQDRGYVTRDGKTGQLQPTNKAYLLINYLYDNEFSNPETTGGWELFLTKIGDGELNPKEFVDAIKDKITYQVQLEKERI